MRSAVVNVGSAVLFVDRMSLHRVSVSYCVGTSGSEEYRVIMGGFVECGELHVGGSSGRGECSLFPDFGHSCVIMGLVGVIGTVR